MDVVTKLQDAIREHWGEFVETSQVYDIGLVAVTMTQLATDQRAFPNLEKKVVEPMLERIEDDEDTHPFWKDDVQLLRARTAVVKFAPTRGARRRVGVTVLDTSKAIKEGLERDTSLEKGSYEWFETVLETVMMELVPKIVETYVSTGNARGASELFSEIARWVDVHVHDIQLARIIYDKLLLAHFAYLGADVTIPKQDAIGRKIHSAPATGTTNDLGLLLDLALSGHDVTDVYDALLVELQTELETNSLSLWPCVQWLVLLRVTNKVTAAPRRAVAAFTGTYAEENNEKEYMEPPPDSEAYLLSWGKIGMVEVKTSSLGKHTGNGVFALTDFEPNDVITQYCGKYYTKLPASIEKRDNTPYLRESREPKAFIDGYRFDPTKLNMRQVGQIIQDPVRASLRNCETKYIMGLHVPPVYRDTSCVSAQVPKDPGLRVHFFEVATRAIKKGEEIFTDYGYDEDVYKQFKMAAPPL